MSHESWVMGHGSWVMGHGWHNLFAAPGPFWDTRLLDPLMNATDVTPSSPTCSLCGRVDDGMDAWLGVCDACLARAGEGAAEPSSHDPDLPHISGYRLRRLIGRGGMGSVYDAERESDGLRIALKVIAPEMAAEPRFLEQFRQEGEALRVLDHPGVVRRLDSGGEDGRPWLAMEFIDGPDLRQVLRLGPLPVARALEIVVEVGAALAAAHAAGIVHRDIKPANVLLDPAGRVKVADFGMARPHGPGFGGTDPPTLVAAAGGHYSAPELEQRGTGDARADVYSLGALLHHLLSGNAPRASYRAARRERPGAGISAGVDRIVARCLQTDPTRRFRSMNEMLAAVERERGRLRLRRRRLVLGLVIAVIALAATFSTAFKMMLPPDEEKVAAELRAQTASRLAPVPVGWNPRTMTNSLGMDFLEVPGTEVLFAVDETRVRDYAAFAEPWPDPEDAWVRETRFAFPVKKPVFSLRQGEFKAAGASWREPGFPSGLDHAVCGVSASDAMAFCTWLTWRERHEGKIGADQAYRLPTDAEWSAAAGLAPEPGDTPEARAASWPTGVFAHPWGFAWPAPDGDYNVVGDEVNGWDNWHPGWLHRPRRDGWRGTAPVDAAPPSPLGLRHLNGNVWEWTETPFNEGEEKHALVLRGGSWLDASREALSTAFRDRDLGTVRMTKRGFRIVFQESEASGWRYGENRE